MGTLLEDLEAAANVLALREANDIQPILDSTLGSRLREHASRLRRELERGEARAKLPHSLGRTKDLVERINGGPLGGSPTPDTGRER